MLKIPCVQLLRNIACSMSRRSLHKAGKTHALLYGPKTDTKIKHWTLDYQEFKVINDDDSEIPQSNSIFQAKVWRQIEDDMYTPIDDGVEGDKATLISVLSVAQAVDAQSIPEVTDAPVNVGIVPSVPPPAAAPEAPAAPAAAPASETISTESQPVAGQETADNTQVNEQSEPKQEANSETKLENPEEIAVNLENPETNIKTDESINKEDNVEPTEATVTTTVNAEIAETQNDDSKMEVDS